MKEEVTGHSRALRWQAAAAFPVLLSAVMVALTFSMVRPFLVDPDLWWHLKTGELMLATRTWPTTDTFSSTAAGLPWISTEWLGEVLFAAAFRLGGLRGLEALLVLLAALVMVSLYGYATLRSRNSTAAFLSTAAVLGMSNGAFNLRPQMIGFLLLVLTLIALERFRQGRRRTIWALPLLFLVWINTHGSWIVGVGVVVMQLVCGLATIRLGTLSSRAWSREERLQLEIVLLLSLAALTVTPYGTALARYPFLYSGSELTVNFALISEWQPMPFNILAGRIFLAMLLAFLFIQIVFRFEWRLDELLLFFVGTAMACLHVRFLLVFVPLFLPLLATTIARWLPPYDPRNDQPGINAVLIAGLAALILWTFPSEAFVKEKVAQRFPADAVEYMRQHPPPVPLLNTYNFGGYLVWSGIPVFVDGRADLFEIAGVLGDYAKLNRLEPGTPRILHSYGIRSALLARGERLSGFLATLPNWQQVYADQVSALYVRSE